MSWREQQNVCVAKTAREKPVHGPERTRTNVAMSGTRPHSQALLGASHHLSDGLALHPGRPGPCPWLCPGREQWAGWCSGAGCTKQSAQVPEPAVPSHGTNVNLPRVHISISCAPTSPLIFMSSVMIKFWNFKQRREDIARSSWLPELLTAVSFPGPRNRWLVQAQGTRLPSTPHAEPTRPGAPPGSWRGGCVGGARKPGAFQGNGGKLHLLSKGKNACQMNNGMVFNNPSVYIKIFEMI